MYSFSTWSAYSTDYSDAESSSVRTSFDTILEYANNLLPPAPLSQKSAACTSMVDCRLRREITNRPARDHSARSINRRSSTVIAWSDDAEITPSVPSLDLSRSSTATIMEVNCPITPPRQTMSQSAQPTLSSPRGQPAPRVRIYEEPFLRDVSPPMSSPKVGKLEVQDDGGFHPSRPVPSIPIPDEGQHSFMLWDDEVEHKRTRVAKVKKSLIDLRNPGRSRSQSVPLQPTRDLNKVVSAGTKSEPAPGACNGPRSIIDFQLDQPKQVVVATKPPHPLSWLSKKKSKKSRRATIGYGNILDTESTVQARRESAISTTRSTRPSPLHESMVAATITDDLKHTDRRRGLSRLTRWMKKLMKAS